MQILAKALFSDVYEVVVCKRVDEINMPITNTVNKEFPQCKANGTVADNLISNQNVKNT